ncbi:MAG: hypothetical protein D6778_08135, partial [Nitrospirae bacterium]
MNRRLYLINLFSLIVIVVFGSLWAEKTLLNIDFTEGKLYTLSSATKDILKKIESPITVKVFFSKEIPYPYNTVSRYVLDILQDYSRVSGNKVRIERVDPDDERFEKLASTYGIPPVQVNTIEASQIKIKKVFLGLGFVSEDRIET